MANPRCSASWRRSSSWVSQFWSLVETRAYSAARFTAVPPRLLPGVRARPGADAGSRDKPNAAPRWSVPPARPTDARRQSTGCTDESRQVWAGWWMSSGLSSSDRGASLAPPFLGQHCRLVLGNKLPDGLQQHFGHFDAFQCTGGLESTV